MDQGKQLLEQFLAEKPNFHEWSDGTAWMVLPDALRWIYDHLCPGMNTLETGAGHSTVVFAVAGTHHICIMPSQEESARITAYCSKLHVGEQLTFLQDSSDTALPCSNLIPPQLDFIFIDGAHRFPFPFIDFHYSASRLKIGGILGLDDTNIPSVKILYDFLCQESDWEKLEKIGKTAFFRKIALPDITDDWQGQNLNKRSLYFQKAKLSKSIKGLLSR